MGSRLPAEPALREGGETVEHEDWIYGTPPLKTVFVRFEGDVVVSVEEYSGGVEGASQGVIMTDPRDSREF